MIANQPKQLAALASPRRGPHDIVLAHGGGGQLTDTLIRQTILPRIGNDVLNELLDGAVLPPTWQDRPVMTIDAYVVQPWAFPGGDIGRLAVCGTVNDLAVCGAKPEAIALSLILAEGFAKRDLETILDSIKSAADEARVHIVTGDTKVVGRGQCDDIYITTAGLGRRTFNVRLGYDRVHPGDVIILSGPIGEHGLAVMLAREMPHVHSVLSSDAAPINHLVEQCLHDLGGDDVVFMRDPTRGGLAGVCADLAEGSGYHVLLEEDAIPIRREALHAAEMLGLDPLEIANEGKLVLVVRGARSTDAVLAMHAHGDLEATVIGRIGAERNGVCELRTSIGGSRVVQKPYGEQLPRIC